MTESRARAIVVTVGLIAALSVSATSAAQGRAVGATRSGGPQVSTPAAEATTRGRPPAVVTDATQVLLAAYPEFWQRAVMTTITPVGAKQAVTWFEGEDPLLAGFQKPPALVVSALVDVSATGELVSFVADGPLVRTSQGKAFAAEAAAHPEWTAEDVAARLPAAGARPASAVAAGLHLASWGRFLGPQPRLRESTQRAKPAGPPGASPGADAAAAPVVVVTVDGRVGGTARAFTIHLDPFSGRIVAVTRP